MKLIKTKFFNGPKLLKTKIFSDSRGFLKETFQNKIIKQNFPFDIMSFSKKNVLRGLHLQNKFSQGKYLTVLKGLIFDVAVDLRKKSKTFGKYFAIKLSDKNSTSIYIPPGFAHGFVGLKKENIISYHCTNYRSKNNEIGIIWNDKDINIKWPVKNPIISKKDTQNITLKNFIDNYG